MVADPGPTPATTTPPSKITLQPGSTSHRPCSRPAARSKDQKGKITALNVRPPPAQPDPRYHPGMPKTRSIRIPDEIDAALTAAAAEEHMPIQSRIVQALERDLAARGQHAPASHTERVADALERIHGRRGPRYAEQMQALEDEHRGSGPGRSGRKAS